MANQISRIRNQITLLVTLTAVAALAFLMWVIPIVSGLTAEATRSTWLNAAILSPLALGAVVLVLRWYLRPISDLGYALEIGSTPTADLAVSARRIALNAPVLLYVLATVGTFLLSLLANVLGTVLWPGYLFREHLLSSLLGTAITASGSLVVSLVCRRLMHPVLSYTSTRVEEGGLRVTIRTRLLVATLSLVALAVLLPGAFGVVRSLGSPDGVRTIAALAAGGALACAMAVLLSHYLAMDIVANLGEVTRRLLDVATEQHADLDSPVPVLAMDRTGDLVVAYNAFQRRVRLQQEQIEQKQRQLMALQSLSFKIGTIRDIEHLLREVIRDVERAFGYHNASILLADHERQELYFAAIGLTDATLEGRRFKIGEDGIVGRVAATATPLLINDVSACDFYIPDKTHTRSELAVPMMSGDQVIGVFNVSSERTGAFEESDLRIVTALSNQVAIAIENARLFSEVTCNTSELESRARNLTILHSVSTALSASLRLEDVLKVVTEQLVDHFAVGHCAVLLLEEEDTYGQVAAEHPAMGFVGQQMRLKGSPLLQRILTEPQLLLFTDAQRSEQLRPLREYLTALDARSTLVVPVTAKGRVEGLIVLSSTGEPRAFTVQELDICETISAQVAVSVENVRLIEGLRLQATALANMARSAAAEKSQLDAILRNLADGLLVTDPEGHIVLYNPAFLHLFRLAEESIVDRVVTEVIPELPLHSLFLQTTQTGIAHVQEMTLADGRFFQITAAGVREGDDLRAIVMVLRDVTRERQMDEMKTRFFSTVSHEFRTPLTPILGFAKLIRKSLGQRIVPSLPPDDHDAHRAAGRINQNAEIMIAQVERLSRLVDDVLFLADLDAGRLRWRTQEVNLAQVLESVYEEYREEAQGKGLEVYTEWPANLPVVHGDTDRLTRAVRNLVSNAVKFTERGQISIRAQVIRQQDGEWEPPPPIHVPEQVSSDSYVLVSVADTGPGVSLEAQQTLFERFGQGMRDMLTDKPTGTGLGLALSKEIIGHHNGQIWVESAPGRGSTFAFVLPFVSTSEEVEVWGQVLSLPDTAPTILVVDDELAMRELLHYVLLRAGYRTMMAVDGPTALNMVRFHKPDLVVLDIMIPGISGLDVTSVLKADAATREIPIVILSIIADEKKAAQLGADACFSKPFDQEVFLRRIGELLALRRMHRKL